MYVRRLYKIMEQVRYKGKTFTVSRYIDVPDDRLLTIEKQEQAKELFNKGVSSAEIAERIDVDESVLNIWWDNESRIEGISKANKVFSQGKAKKVIVTNLDSGVSACYPSLSAAGKAVGCLASTVRYKILQGKQYKNYSFKYADED